MTGERVLLVDDEPNVLSGYKRGLRGQFDVTVAESGPDALEIIESSPPFAVVVSDMRMPVMNGVELLKKVTRIAPDSVRMMLTGNADQETAIQAVNQGRIFRFLNKPCPPESLSAVLAAGVAQYHLVIAEKELLEKTLKGSVELLTEVLSLTDPKTFALATKVNDYFNSIKATFQIEKPWELEVATLLAPIGLITLPPELNAKSNAHTALTPREEEAVRSAPDIGARLLAHIPRLEKVADIIRCGVEEERGNQIAARLPEGTALGLGVIRLLFEVVRHQQTGMKAAQIFDQIAKQRVHAPALIEKVRNALKKSKPELFAEEFLMLELALNKVCVGDELSSDVTSKDGRLLLAAGAQVTGPLLERLFNYRKLVGLREPISVKRIINPGG